MGSAGGLSTPGPEAGQTTATLEEDSLKELQPQAADLRERIEAADAQAHGVTGSVGRPRRGSIR